MTRQVPNEVKRILRKEVGFGCPIPDCGKPYLEWHHFDPPWNIKNHHNPLGMIALCREHHIQADNNAFTKEQLHNIKKNGVENWRKIQGKFNWLRNDILLVVGGNYFLNPKKVVTFQKSPLLWFTRDNNNYLLLNLYIFDEHGSYRKCVVGNEWYTNGLEYDIECPPSAKELNIYYKNGDFIKVAFQEINEVDGLIDKSITKSINFPITKINVSLKMNFAKLEVKNNSLILNSNTFQNCFFENTDCAILIN